MTRLNNQFLNFWVRNLEVTVTVIWLIYFLGVGLPSPLPSLINALSYPVIVILIIPRWKHLCWVATRDIPLLLLTVIVLASVFWSVNLGATLNGCRGFVRTFLFGAYFTTRYSLKEQIKILVWVFGIVAILSTIVTLLIPSYGIGSHGEWRGIFPHKNILGYATTIGSILFLLTVIQKQTVDWLAWIGFLLTIALAVLAQSSSALVSLLLLLSFMPIYKLVKQHYKLRVILFSLTFILIGSAAILILGNIETILVDILGEGLTYNGRTPIWDLVVEKTWERPFLGYGYNAFWPSDAGMHVILNTWASNNIENVQKSGFNAHSGYFELLPQLGFLGISLYAISLVTVFFRVFTLFLSTKKIEFFCLFQFLIFMCVSNIGDMFVSILGTNSYSSIYVAVCLSTAVEWKRTMISQKRYISTNLSTINNN